ncbi:MAG: PhzF family phenazine biosynthesis protein [Bacteroidota bacterium]
MIPFKIYQVFSKEEIGFKGNTAAVVLLEDPLEPAEMQTIAADLSQPATTFLRYEKGSWSARWFAPDEEIPLCGHGAFAGFAFLKDQGSMQQSVLLNYTGGSLNGYVNNSSISLSLSAIPTLKKINPPKAIQEGLNIPILEMYETSNKHLIVTKRASHVENMDPNFSKLRESKIFGYTVTAPGYDVDFVSRTLVPHVNQLEDHATGSSHAILTPYWADRLKRRNMTGKQLSKRGGYFECELYANQVNLSGESKLIAKGEVIVHH